MQTESRPMGGFFLDDACSTLGLFTTRETIMTRIRIYTALLAAALATVGAPALAEPSCTNWMLQSDGSYFRTCVDDQGRQYCESSKNGQVSRVSCR